MFGYGNQTFGTIVGVAVVNRWREQGVNGIIGPSLDKGSLKGYALPKWRFKVGPLRSVCQCSSLLGPLSFGSDTLANLLVSCLSLCVITG